jgi:hypothetical protein
MVDPTKNNSEYDDLALKSLILDTRYEFESKYGGDILIWYKEVSTGDADTLPNAYKFKMFLRRNRQFEINSYITKEHLATCCYNPLTYEFENMRRRLLNAVQRTDYCY